ncbi:TlpA disulfide reductase family protein [Christiangramia sp. SM2212]|uniref:TlpA disulfide reductase family protein n=1 Tax=Christiangramia sediminicola TaxID=3073267 RepID=A0ABU1ERH8_9FLAO|nr:TlpA disulfide reductase family protein [Christiangramia sp. SM2212]MDR5590997.1 TlpA disulfide reductase family protein [Christiangramia sp. SM2212]
MNYLSKFMALAVLVSVIACDEKKETDEGMEMGNLYLSKSKPQPGQDLLIKYNNQGEEAPEATVNYLVGKKYYPADIDLKDSANALYGKISIPDTVHAMAFNFKSGDKYDSNDTKGYVFSLYDEEGKELKKSKATKGVYFTRAANSFDVKLENDSIAAILENAIKEDPEIEESFDVDYSNALLAVDKEKGNKYIQKRIDYYSSKDSLKYENYEALSELYSLKNDDTKNDSITSIAAKKFPKSDLARTETMYLIVEAKSLDEKLELYNEYIDLVGKKPRYQNDIMLRFIANEYVKNNDWDQVEKYASQINDPRELARFYNSIAWEKAKKGEDLETAVRLSKNSIDALNNAKGDYSAKPEFYSKSQYDSALEWGISNYSDTYALIQFQQGNLDAAIKTQEKALTDKSGADMTTRYVQYLIEAEKYKKAQEKAADFIANNRANAEMTDYLKTAYAENDNSEKFENYLSKLEAKATNKAREDLRKNMQSEKAKDFELTDLEGNMVKLSDLRGKTVILDFWATWCRPCKQSFPGMQRAVEEYADNDNVEFLFVNTWENGDDREKMVSDYIKGENYDFHVIMDQPVLEGSREFITTSNFGINGIPTKIIVGPDGNVNFKTVGYSGNNEKMLKEIGLMIELTQDNKTPEA